MSDNTPQTNYQLVIIGGKAVGWINPVTGVYTEAVKCEPPGQPVGRYKPISKYWGD